MEIKIPKEWVAENFRTRVIYKKIANNQYKKIEDVFEISQESEYFLVLNSKEAQAKIYYTQEKNFRLMIFILLFLMSSVILMTLLYNTNEWSFYPMEIFSLLTIINSYLFYSLWIKDKSSIKFRKILEENLKL